MDIMIYFCTQYYSIGIFNFYRNNYRSIDQSRNNIDVKYIFFFHRVCRLAYMGVMTFSGQSICLFDDGGVRSLSVK